MLPTSEDALTAELSQNTLNIIDAFLDTFSEPDSEPEPNSESESEPEPEPEIVPKLPSKSQTRISVSSSSYPIMILFILVMSSI
jgi:hypothetical protein